MQFKFPLTDLFLGKLKEFNFSTSVGSIFDELKLTVSTTVVAASHCPNAPLDLLADPSDTLLDVVL